jgi:hypothetical protein
LDANNGGDNEPEPTEKSPLNGTDVEAATEKELEANGANGKEAAEEKSKANGLVVLLSQPKTRLIGLAVLIGLLTVVAVVLAWCCISSSGDTDIWIEDPTPRALRVIPTPNGARNLIRYKAGRSEEGGIWPNLTAEIDNLYIEYSPERLTSGKDVVSCPEGQSPPEGKACYFGIDQIKNLCTQDTKFGYPEGSPCVFIQLNFRELFNFTPEVYSKDELQERATNLVTSLQKVKTLSGPYIDCQANSPIDEENAGQIKTAPSLPVFPANYFPYNGHADYMAPLIAIKFEKPVTGIVIGVTCRLWSKNIGTKTVMDAETNSTRIEIIDESLPHADLPFNILIE